MRESALSAALKKAAAAVLTAAMVITAVLFESGLTAQVTAGAEEEDNNNCEIYVYTYNADKSIDYITDLDTYIAPGGRIPTSQLNLPEPSGLVKPYDGAVFQGWYVNTYQSYYDRHTQDQPLGSFTMPADSDDDTWLHIYIYPKFDKQVYGDYDIDYLEGNWSDFSSKVKIDPLKAYSDDELLKMASDNITVDADCEPTWYLRKQGMSNLTFCTRVKKVKVTFTYHYADTYNKEKTEEKIQYIAPGSLKTSDLSSAKKVRFDDMKSPKTDFTLEKVEDKSDENDDFDDDTETTYHEITAGEINRELQEKAESGNYYNINLYEEYPQKFTTVKAYVPGVSHSEKRANYSNNGRIVYQLQYPDIEEHSLFFDKSSITAKDLNEKVKDFSRTSKKSGLTYTGYSNVFEYFSYDSDTGESVPNYEDDGDAIEDGYNGSQKTAARFSGASYVAFITYDENSDDERLVDVDDKIVTPGSTIQLPKESTRYKDLRFNKLLTYRADGREKWEEYDFTKPIVAKDGESYYIFSHGTDKNTASDDGVYHITYYLNGGYADNPETYTADTETFMLKEPTRGDKDGALSGQYTFMGWQKDGNGTPQKTVTITKGSTGDLVYSASWRENTPYTISYDLNAGEDDDAGIDSPDLTYYAQSGDFELKRPYRDGYTFIGWTGSNGTVPQRNVTVKSGTTGNLSYKANWRSDSSGGDDGQDTPVTYTITYELAGGSVTGNPASYTADTDTFTLQAPIRNGYIFTGWTGSNGTTPQTTVTIAKGSTGDRSYTANWQQNSVTPSRPTDQRYNISYDLAGGSATGNPASYTADDAAFTLRAPTRSGYTFIGWTGSNGATPQTIVTIASGTTGDLLYTANWRRNAATYTISYTLNGGTVTGNPASYTDESESFTLKNPSRDGYTFTGWTGSNGTTPQITVTVAKGTKENLSYTANWQLNPGTYTITYNLNGGTATGNPEIYTAGTNTFTLSNPTRSGYTFTGWTGSNGNTPQISVTVNRGTTGNLTYTANWQVLPQSYTITYNLNGGTAFGNPPSYSSLSSTFSLVPPARAGYIFLGWTGSNGSTPQTVVTIRQGTSGNLTYTANWQAASDSSSGSGSDSGSDSNEEITVSDNDTEDDLSAQENRQISSVHSKRGRITKLSAGKKKLTLKYKKVTVSGAKVKYEVAIKQKNAKKWKKYRTSGTKKVIKKLKSGKTYWISVRPYIVIDDVRYKGKWADTLVKKVK